MDWSSFTNRISELETKRKPSANRRAVFEVIRNSKLRPNPDYDASLYLGPLIDPQGRPLCLEYTNDRPNLWFHESHVRALQDAGLDPSRKPPSGSDSEGRHSGLKSKGFQDIDAWKLSDLDPDRARAALTALGFAGDFQLDPTAVKRWIERLQHFFPSLDRFDRPDPDFDEAERNYKLATINKLRPALESAGDDSSITEAVFTAATDSNNLLDWRTSEPLSPKSNAVHGLLDPAWTDCCFADRCSLRFARSRLKSSTGRFPRRRSPHGRFDFWPLKLSAKNVSSASTTPPGLRPSNADEASTGRF